MQYESCVEVVAEVWWHLLRLRVTVENNRKQATKRRAAFTVLER